jgi:hypothetical protein
MQTVFLSKARLTLMETVRKYILLRGDDDVNPAGRKQGYIS